MKFNLKSFTIFSLAFTFILSGIFCCCFTPQVEAEESVPSCHQAAHQDHDTSSNKEECECEQNIALLDKEVFFEPYNFSLVEANFELDFQYNEPPADSIIAYQAPPEIYEALPLYLKHSILRV